jgi:hypothetical protein
MAKRKGVIPISDARDLGKKRECPMVVIFAIEKSRKRFTVTTWGETKEMCQLAAGYGDDIADALLGGTLIARQTPDGLAPEPTITEWSR